MLIPRKLAGVVSWCRHVALGRFNLSPVRIVGCSMWAIRAGFQKLRLSLALTMGCSIKFSIAVCCRCFGFRIFVWIS